MLQMQNEIYFLVKSVLYNQQTSSYCQAKYKLVSVDHYSRSNNIATPFSFCVIVANIECYVAFHSLYLYDQKR